MGIGADVGAGLAMQPAVAHTIVFTHIPPFITDPNELKNYFNYDPAVRAVSAQFSALF